MSPGAETRQQFRDRLQDNGVWREFVDRRTQLQERLGGNKNAAGRAAAAEYPISKFPPRGRAAPVDRPEPVVGPPLLEAVSREEFEGRERPPLRAVVEWVFENLDVLDVDVSGCPSAGAWSLLAWCRLGPDNRTEFYKTFASKLLPTRRQLDEEEGRGDDGGSVQRTIDRLLAFEDAVQPPGAEGDEGELALSAEGVGVGERE